MITRSSPPINHLLNAPFFARSSRHISLKARPLGSCATCLCTLLCPWIFCAIAYVMALEQD